MPEAILHKETGTITLLAVAAVVAGEIAILAGNRAGVAVAKADIGEQASYYTEGQFDVASASATTFTKGDGVWWDVSANVAVPDGSAGTGDVYLGPALADKADGDLTVRVDLNVPLVSLHA